MIILSICLDMCQHHLNFLMCAAVRMAEIARGTARRVPGRPHSMRVEAFMRASAELTRWEAFWSRHGEQKMSQDRHL